MINTISFIISIVSLIVICLNIAAIYFQNRIAVKNATNERFKNAIDQLGNEKNTIILGAIYTLHRIAKEDESYRENVFNILCSYVRDTTTTIEYQKKYKDKPSEPIQTILNILCVNEEDREVYYIEKNIKEEKNKIKENKLEIDFSGAYLSGAYLIRGEFINAILKKTNLISVNLSHAKILNSCFDEAIFINATMEGIKIKLSMFEKTNFIGAILSFSIFDSVSLTCSDFSGANLRKAYLNNISTDSGKFIASFLCRASFENMLSLHNTDFTGSYTDEDLYYRCDNFVDRIKFRVSEEVYKSDIVHRFAYEKPQEDEIILRRLTKEEADKIIKEYNEAMKGIKKE